MRVVAGELGGRRLHSPPRRSAAVRPTTDRVREALFSILGDVEGAAVLDLYCGTGALGIEAVSRGAAGATLVDTHTTLARRNVSDLELGDRCEVVRADARAYLRRTRRSFDLIFCDPPYRLADRLEGELDSLIGSRLAQGGRLILEGSARRPSGSRPAARARAALRRHSHPHSLRGRKMSNGRIAVCPGTYDPVTNGHLDIIGRAARVFDRVVVGVVNQPVRKQTTLFTAEERKAFIDDAVAGNGVDNVDVVVFSNLLVEMAREQGAGAIVKGLRAISDFEYEFEMNQLNRKLAPDIESVYIIASPDYSFLSSTGVKEMATFGGDVSDLVPAGVAEALADRLKR